MGKPKHQWQKLKCATRFSLAEDVALARQGYDPAVLDAHEDRTTYWVNDIYQVSRTDLGENGVHLNIRRRDGKPIFRDWRHFQLIKDQLIGPECEAVELYPANSRLIDTSNKYHLWGCSDPAYRFPIGWDYRDVQDKTATKSPGLQQRKLTTEL